MFYRRLRIDAPDRTLLIASSLWQMWLEFQVDLFFGCFNCADALPNRLIGAPCFLVDDFRKFVFQLSDLILCLLQASLSNIKLRIIDRSCAVRCWNWVFSTRSRVIQSDYGLKTLPLIAKTSRAADWGEASAEARNYFPRGDNEKGHQKFVAPSSTGNNQAGTINGNDDKSNFLKFWSFDHFLTDDK